MARKFEKLGVLIESDHSNVDVTESMSFPQGHFDAIFCMDGIHYFGGTVGFVERIAALLQPSGVLCVGKPVFQQGVYGGRTRRLVVGI